MLLTFLTGSIGTLDFASHRARTAPTMTNKQENEKTDDTSIWQEYFIDHTHSPDITVVLLYR